MGGEKKGHCIKEEEKANRRARLVPTHCRETEGNIGAMQAARSMEESILITARSLYYGKIRSSCLPGLQSQCSPLLF